MIGIGGCDYCGEFCSTLGVLDPEPIGVNGWVPPSQIERHQNLVARRLACAEFDGSEYVIADHVGPYHDRRGRPLDTCRQCDSRSAMSYEWSSWLDHAACEDCWSKIAGGLHLRRLRAKAKVADAPGLASTKGEPGTGTPADDDAHRSTAPADRARVEAAFRAYLGRRMLPIDWVTSPRGVVEALGRLIADGELDPRSEEHMPLWSIRAHPTDAQGGDSHECPADDPADPGEPSASIAALVAAAIGPTSGLERADVAGILVDAGQFANPADTPPPDDPALGRLLAELHASCGPVVVLTDRIVASERPLVARFDAEGRLHAEDGPALAWPGLVIHAWHGVAVDAAIIERPEEITVDWIDAEWNAEVRRLLIERFGIERYLRQSGATLIHEDETGRLWRREGRPTDRRSRPDEPIVAVEVVNATPEPDGTRRTFFLRVPPTMTTAREAVAWTFGMTGEEYWPAVES